MKINKGFLDNIADRYFKEYGENIKDISFVFPNRRSAVYFRNSLTLLSSVPLWSPAIFSINDLIRECSGLDIPDELIFELYNVYREVFPEKSISMEKFFQTGKIIISDLNEIDKGLADTELLFTALKDLHGLEDPEPLNNPEIKKDYREFWIDLEDIYHPFRRALGTHQTGYEGMAFRKVAENIDLVLKKGWEKIVFAGFNALSGAERSIQLQLKAKGKTEIFSEADFDARLSGGIIPIFDKGNSFSFVFLFCLDMSFSYPLFKTSPIIISVENFYQVALFCHHFSKAFRKTCIVCMAPIHGQMRS